MCANQSVKLNIEPWSQWASNGYVNEVFSGKTKSNARQNKEKKKHSSCRNQKLVKKSTKKSKKRIPPPPLFPANEKVPPYKLIMCQFPANGCTYSPQLSSTITRNQSSTSCTQQQVNYMVTRHTCCQSCMCQLTAMAANHGVLGPQPTQQVLLPMQPAIRCPSNSLEPLLVQNSNATANITKYCYQPPFITLGSPLLLPGCPYQLPPVGPIRLVLQHTEHSVPYIKIQLPSIHERKCVKPPEVDSRSTGSSGRRRKLIVLPSEEFNKFGKRILRKYFSRERNGNHKNCGGGVGGAPMCHGGMPKPKPSG